MINGPAAAPSKVRRPSGKRARVRRALRRIDKVFPARKYRQYVNMAQGTNRTKHGRKITIKARVKPRKAGVSVEWIIDTPKAAGRTNRRGLSPAQRAFLSNVSSTTDDKGVAEVTLTLSSYGGDRFRVGARIKGRMKYKKYSGWFHVWRKLYFDIAEMKTKDGTSKYELPAAVVNRIKAGFKKVFIELKDTGKRHLGDYKDNFDTVEKGFKWGDKYFAKDGVPQKLHFCMIDHCTTRHGKYGAHTRPLEDEANAVQFTSTMSIIPYDFDGHNWLVKAEYEGMVSGLFGPKLGWKEFAAGKVELVGTRGWRKVKVDFGGSGRTPSATNKVKFRVNYLKPWNCSGWGGSNSLHLLICRGFYLDYWSQADADNMMAGTGLHEVGHAMGLVDASEAWHDSAHVNNPNHCKYKKCAMWYENYVGRGLYHDEKTSDPGCQTRVREKELTKSALQTKWKFPR